LILWLLGFSFHIAGCLIQLLLVIAVVVLVINLISGVARHDPPAVSPLQVRPRIYVEEKEVS
jgi:hypothetical protein